MQMRTVFAASAIGLAIACIAGFASAQQIYKWKDSTGVTHYSQTPPANGAQYTKMNVTSESEGASNPPPAVARASETASDDTDPVPQPADEQTTQVDTPSNRAALCKQLNSNITLLQSEKPVIAGDDDGKPQVMSDDAREQQLATARAQQAQYCAGG